MLNTNENNVDVVEEVESVGDNTLKKRLKLAKRVSVEELLDLDPEPEPVAENVWTKEEKENLLLNGVISNGPQKNLSPFSFMVKKLLPCNGDYHFTFINYDESLNSVKPGGYISSYCTLGFALLSIDNVEYELKQVFSDKELSLKLFQGFINSLLECLGITEVVNPRDLIGCTGECTVKNSSNENRRYANISTFIQAELPKKELK
ncbi:MAG: hypothetical protein ACOH15_05000 [Acetobacterium sp.]